jgi:CRISP-associated protein Cas1
MGDVVPIRVMALHALAYCERLFYLEEVEEIRVADDRVYNGRRLLESAVLGIKGKLDALRRRGGPLIPYEHKGIRTPIHI